MSLRNRRLLDLAHGLHECTLQVPGVCLGYAPDGLEPCHGPKSLLNGGMGCKSDDVFAAACAPCHREVDQGKALAREDRQFYLLRGIARTWAALMKAGALEVGKVRVAA